jgi:hypothetical protein
VPGGSRSNPHFVPVAQSASRLQTAPNAEGEQTSVTVLHAALQQFPSDLKHFWPAPRHVEQKSPVPWPFVEMQKRPGQQSVPYCPARLLSEHGWACALHPHLPGNPAEWLQTPSQHGVFGGSSGFGFGPFSWHVTPFGTVFGKHPLSTPPVEEDVDDEELDDVDEVVLPDVDDVEDVVLPDEVVLPEEVDAPEDEDVDAPDDPPEDDDVRPEDDPPAVDDVDAKMSAFASGNTMPSSPPPPHAEPAARMVDATMNPTASTDAVRMSASSIHAIGQRGRGNWSLDRPITDPCSDLRLEMVPSGA